MSTGFSPALPFALKHFPVVGPELIVYENVDTETGGSVQLSAFAGVVQAVVSDGGLHYVILSSQGQVAGTSSLGVTGPDGNIGINYIDTLGPAFNVNGAVPIFHVGYDGVAFFNVISAPQQSAPGDTLAEVLTALRAYGLLA